MMRHLVLATLALAAASPAAAQIRIPPIRLITGVGSAAQSSYGIYRAQGGQIYNLIHQQTPALQLGLETTSPVRGVDLRLNLQHTNPMLMRSQFPEPGSPDGIQQVYRTRVQTLTLDAAVHLPRLLDMQPYALAGVGVTRFDFKETYYHASNQPVTPPDETRPTLHLGLGTAWNVGRYDLFVEGSAFLTRRPDYSYGGIRLESEHNGSITAGVRIPIHR